jgi:hypothetical protein
MMVVRIYGSYGNSKDYQGPNDDHGAVFQGCNYVWAFLDEGGHVLLVDMVCIEPGG